MRLQRRITVSLQLGAQGALLLCGDAAAPSWRRRRGQIVQVAAAGQQALDGGQAHPEGGHHLLAGHATIDSGEDALAQVN